MPWARVTACGDCADGSTHRLVDERGKGLAVQERRADVHSRLFLARDAGGRGALVGDGRARTRGGGRRVRVVCARRGRRGLGIVGRLVRSATRAGRAGAADLELVQMALGASRDEVRRQRDDRARLRLPRRCTRTSQPSSSTPLETTRVVVAACRAPSLHWLSIRYKERSYSVLIRLTRWT